MMVVPNGRQPPLPAAAAQGAAPPATAPRMSNAFVRRHGLNPKDTSALNLRRITMQNQAPQV